MTYPVDTGESADQMTTATMPPELRLTHLKQLEAEAIHIIREVVAQFDKPVMLYSIGKDSSVLLHLARKAFHPGKIPFPLLHIDTTWKFSRDDHFRDRMARRSASSCSSTPTRTASPRASIRSITARRTTPTS